MCVWGTHFEGPRPVVGTGEGSECLSARSVEMCRRYHGTYYKGDFHIIHTVSIRGEEVRPNWHVVGGPAFLPAYYSRMGAVQFANLLLK